MSVPELLEWQWQNYHITHRSRVNLIIHIVAVPCFILSTLALITFLLKLNLAGAALSFPIALLAFGTQGIGHKQEESPAEPFASPTQAVLRIFLEQYVTFPRYVLSGGWYAALIAK